MSSSREILFVGKMEDLKLLVAWRITRTFSKYILARDFRAKKKIFFA